MSEKDNITWLIIDKLFEDNPNILKLQPESSEKFEFVDFEEL